MSLLLKAIGVILLIIGAVFLFKVIFSNSTELTVTKLIMGGVTGAIFATSLIFLEGSIPAADQFFLSVLFCFSGLGVSAVFARWVNNRSYARLRKRRWLRGK